MFSYKVIMGGGKGAVIGVTLIGSFLSGCSLSFGF